jgi:hypothetical protein
MSSSGHNSNIEREVASHIFRTRGRFLVHNHPREICWFGSEDNLPATDFTIEHVMLTHLQLSGADLEPLKLLRGLKGLALNKSTLTRDALAVVGALQTLYTLDLDDTHCDDTWMPHIARLSNLTSLSLDGTNVSDTGIGDLANLQNLERLKLSRTLITDASLEIISRFERLVVLDLSRTAIKGSGIQHLRRLSHLFDLDLSHTSLTDQSLECLVDYDVMEDLSELHVDGTHVSKAMELRIASTKPFSRLFGVPDDIYQR